MLAVSALIYHTRYFGGSLELVSLDGWGKLSQYDLTGKSD